MTLRESRNVEIDRVYAIVLNGGDGVSLSSPLGALRFESGEHFRIIRDPDAGQETFRVTTVAYMYSLAHVSGPDLLTFHWTPETRDSSQRTYPHVHIEDGLIGHHPDKQVRSFNKLHIPTGRVSGESIVRFAIEELKVPPVRRDWRSVLESRES